MSWQEAQIIFAPFASPMNGVKRFSVWEKYMAARAYDNRVYIAACNFKGLALWNPYGNLVSSYKKDDENITVFDLDNKQIVKLSDNPDEIKVNGGFLRYGSINSNYVLIAGSVPGPKKRMVLMKPASRLNKTVPKELPSVTYISNEPKQGK